MAAMLNSIMDNQNFKYIKLPPRPRKLFGESNFKYVQEILQIIKDSKDVIAAEPTLLEIQSPCVIVGSIHGHFEELKRIFRLFDREKVHGQMLNRHLFLGNYIDLGPQSLECILTLLLNKIAYPELFYILRGANETMAIKKENGFWQELRDHFEKDETKILWKSFNDLFAHLPLAAIIGEKILCMHGGIGPSLTSLDDIRSIKRPLENPFENKLACDLLWADLMNGIKGFIQKKNGDASVLFGEDAVINVCEKLKVDLIVRAHQIMPNGYGFFCKRKMLTVSSFSKYFPGKN